MVVHMYANKNMIFLKFPMVAKSFPYFFNWGFRIKHFQNQKNACLPKTNVFTCFICFATMVERLFRECDSQVDKSTFLACLLCDSCNLEIKSPSGT